MKLIISPWRDPFLNLALEEVMLNSCRQEDYFLLWQNRDSLIVGKHQNTLAEINEEAAEAEGVCVARRITGGGAVFQDEGNVNFSFLCDCRREEDSYYERFLNPIQRMLAELKVDAVLNGRNDLLVGDRKISGNAQLIRGDRILHHGTLLFDTDLNKMERLLRVSRSKLQGKGIASVRSRVENIRSYISCKDMTTDDFCRYMQKFMEREGAEVKKLFPDLEHKAQELAEKKFSTYEWNYGESPNYTVTGSGRFAGGYIEVGLLVEEGIITSCKIQGDYLGRYPVEELENSLLGTRYMRTPLKEALDEISLESYLGDIRKEEFLSCLWG